MAVRQKDVSREALSRLPSLGRAELRAEWQRLYGTDAPVRLGHELLIGAIAWRLQEPRPRHHACGACRHRGTGVVGGRDTAGKEHRPASQPWAIRPSVPQAIARRACSSVPTMTTEPPRTRR